MRRLGIIGAGGMAQGVVAALARGLARPLEHVAVLARADGQAGARDLLAASGAALAAGSSVHAGLGGLLATRPDVVAECAGHSAVREHGQAVLDAGCDLVVISIGALADDGLRQRLQAAAARSGARMVLPAGAIGGIDALHAARLSGLEEVVYSGRKPPPAWRGTPAERVLDLDRLEAAAVVFEGTAREAASAYPQNANVAAAVALAGLGFDATRARLVADPAVAGNVHEISVRSTACDFTLRLEGRPSPTNPKTSLTACFSVARELLNRTSFLVI